MGATDKFCLRWNDFESNISLAFRELRHESDFFDVTLACEDDRQIQAHKLILSACSPFFKHVLRTNPHAQPLLYLKGVRYADMLAVLNFMYHGEVNVSQDELNSFLAVAEELNVKGLTTGATATDASAPTSTSTPGAKNHHKRSATATSHGGPAKRGRKSAATLAAQAAQEQAAAAQPKDEALEGGIRVKDEPRPGHSAAEDNFGDSFGQDGGGAAAADDDGGYDNYEGFGDGAGDYGDEGQLMDPNVSLGANSGDGSKDLPELSVGGDGSNGGGGSSSSGNFYSCGQELDFLDFDGLTTYVCKLCGKKSNQLPNAKRHVKFIHFKVHENAKCPHCSKVFNRKQNLDIHLRKAHQREAGVAEEEVVNEVLQPQEQQ